MKKSSCYSWVIGVGIFATLVWNINRERTGQITGILEIRNNIAPRNIYYIDNGKDYFTLSYRYERDKIEQLGAKLLKHPNSRKIYDENIVPETRTSTNFGNGVPIKYRANSFHNKGFGDIFGANSATIKLIIDEKLPGY